MMNGAQTEVMTREEVSECSEGWIVGGMYRIGSTRQGSRDKRRVQKTMSTYVGDNLTLSFHFPSRLVPRRPQRNTAYITAVSLPTSSSLPTPPFCRCRRLPLPIHTRSSS
eukprot:scaffold114_cov200-Alexandrium_tamarense.AAC.10